MSSDPLDLLLADSRDLRDQGRKYVALRSLEAALIDLKNRTGSSGEAHRQTLIAEGARYDLYGRMIEGTLKLGSDALKVALLVNAGAAVALLSFIGTDAASPVRNGLADSMASFLLGVLCCAIGAGTAYLTQYCWTEGFRKIGHCLFLATCVLILCSYLSFGIGGNRGYNQMKNWPNQQPVYPPVSVTPAAVAPVASSPAVSHP